MHENPIYTEVNDPRYPQTVGRIELAPYHGMLTQPPLDEAMNTGGRGISFIKPPLDEVMSGVNVVQVEQDIYDKVLEEAELKKAEEIAAAGKAFWDAALAGFIQDFGGGGMMSTPKDEGRRKPVKMENLRGEKAGWKMVEGSNFWSVDEKDPYWQTKEGHTEAMNLYGSKPSWVKEPSLEYNPKTGEYDPIEKEEFVDLKPTKRISL